MKFSTPVILAALATITNAHVIVRRQAGGDDILSIELKAASDNPTGVNIAVTNKGSTSYSFYNQNNILDDAPSLKYSVTQNGTQVPFLGMWKHLDLSGQLDPMLTAIEAGATLDITTDAADIYDLRAGGAFQVVAEGAIPYASEDGTKFAGVADYKSNTLQLQVSGAARRSVLAPVAHRVMQKRTDIFDDEGGCTTEQVAAIDESLATAGDWARQAADSIINGDDRFSRFFGLYNDETRENVATFFDEVAEQVDPDGGDDDDGDRQPRRTRNADGSISRRGLFARDDEEVTIYCTEETQPNPPTTPICQANSYAYSFSNTQSTVLCGLFWQVPNIGACRTSDRAGTIVHEMTHQEIVVGETVTEDVGSGYDQSVALADNLKPLNADNYAFFAQTVALNCPVT